MTRQDGRTSFVLVRTTVAYCDGWGRMGLEWVGFKSMWDTTEQTTNDQIEQIGG